METLLWSDVFKIPHPQWILSVFWQSLILFWRHEIDPSLEFSPSLRLPHSVSEIECSIHPKGFSSRRYHLFPLSDSDTMGIWDESPFDLSVSSEFRQNPPFVQHGYQHVLSSFLKDVEQHILPLKEKDPQFELLSKIIHKTPLLHQPQCLSCKEILDWCDSFLETEWKKHKVSVAPSVLMFLLQYKNKRRQERKEDETRPDKQQCLDVIEKALHQFLASFFKIQEQTSMDPKILIQGMIDILDEKQCSFGTLEEKEKNCSQDIKSFLLTKLKYIKTKTIEVNHFPRLLIIAREAFSTLTESIQMTQPKGLIGHLVLMNFLFFEDRPLETPPTEKDLVVFHDFKGGVLSERYFTREECRQFNDYHPLIRPSLFYQETES